MIRTLRAIFLARPVREKLLILLLVAALAAIWCSSFAGRLGDWITLAGTAGRQLRDQASWIARKDRIEANARSQAKNLDPGRTLDSLRLNGTVQDLARDAGLTGFNIGSGQDLSNGQFAVHSVSFSVTKASWESIQAFYYRLQARAPYIGIDAFSLAADRNNPANLNAQMTISSVEIVRGAP